MGSRLDDARAAARRSLPATLDSLEEWLRMPSVSGDPAHRRDLEAAARWLERRLRRMTPQVDVLRSASGSPVAVVARIGAHRGGDAGRRGAVVLYGHFDVKPPGPGWHTSPFAPVRHGGRLVARGASDDKGPLLALVAACEAWDAAGGAPVDILLVADAGEEVGSPGFRRALLAARAEPVLGGPVLASVICDTRAAAPGRPTVTTSQRGLLDVTITVSRPGIPVHAGRYGGDVVDPTLTIAGMLAAAARAVIGREPARRGTTADPAVSVTSLRAGGTPGAIPTSATAVLDIRIPPGTSPGTVRTRVEVAIAPCRPAGASVTLDWRRMVAGIRFAPPAEVTRALSDACELGFGVAPTVVASGGSIPAAATLRRVFGVDPVLFGFSPSDDGAHGPDEHLDLRDWAKAVDTLVVLLHTLVHSSAKQGTPHAGASPRTSPVARSHPPQHLPTTAPRPSAEVRNAPVMNRGFTDDSW